MIQPLLGLLHSSNLLDNEMLRDNIPEIRGWGDKKTTAEVLSLGSLGRGLSEVHRELLWQSSPGEILVQSGAEPCLGTGIRVQAFI